MRAKEFINEAKKGKLSDHQQVATRGLNKFTDSTFDRVYMLNRVMMAVASTDGKTYAQSPAESWIGKYNSAHPYTKAEQDMLNMAYETVGIPKIEDLNKGNMESEELSDTNIQSPVKPFKGYKK
jgi:hypothetical protein